MFTSNEQISPPSLVLNCKVAKFCIKECPKAVNLKRISTQKECKCKEFSLQTRLGGEICSSDVIMHKGHSREETLLQALLHFPAPSPERPGELARQSAHARVLLGQLCSHINVP